MSLPKWKDRRIERENTFNVLNNKDGTITLIPVTGEIYEAGTPLNALNLNKINEQLETKASKGDVARISSGTPLFANSVIEMIDTTKNYVNTTDGFLYIYNEGSWTKTSVQYQSTGIAKGAITHNEILETYPSTGNLFKYDNADVIDGKLLIATTGEERDNTISQSYAISHYIEVTEGVRYATSSSPQEVCCFYDTNKSFVGGIQDLNLTGKEYSFVVPTGMNIKYMRVNINKNITPLKEYIVSVGGFVSNKYLINWLGINNENLLPKSIENSHFKEPILPISIEGIEFIYGNVFNFNSNKIILNSFLMANTGEKIESERYAISHPIKVKKGDIFTATYTAQQVCCFYDENNVFIEGIEDLTITTDEPRSFIVPDNDKIKYMRVNLRVELHHLNEYMIVPGEKYPNEYISYSENKYNIKWLNMPDISNVKNIKDFTGKRWLTIGDSITEKNFRATKNYHDYIKEWLGCEVINVAASGTGYIHEFQGVKGWLDRLPTFPSESEVDFITVMGALNDRHHPVGEFGSTDTTELYGALKAFYDGMIEKYPNTPIGVITSTPRDYSWGKNGEFTPHVNAVIDMAEHYSLPLLDLYRCSGLRPWNPINNKEYFSCSSSPTGDGVHPNDKGQLVMAHKIYDFITQFLYK